MNTFLGEICLRKKRQSFLSQTHLKLRNMSKAEKFIQDCTRNCSNEIIVPTQDGNTYTKGYDHWLTPDQARKAVEIAREEELEYVKYQLELRLPETLDYNGIKVNRKDFINDFTKAMKDE